MTGSARKFQFLILGAGPTGLGAAHRLKELGQNDFIVIDRDSQVGGLAQSLTDPRGFTWDIGGHIHFSNFDYYNRLLDETLGADGWLEHKRESWVWMKNRFIPYPLQKNIHLLPQADLQNCLDGLRKRPAKGRKIEAPSFATWALEHFGPGLYELFLKPYNEKVWGHRLEEMNHLWIHERVATLSLREIEDRIQSASSDADWGPNSHFRYPKNGGTGLIWRKISERVGAPHFILGCEALEIDEGKCKLQTSQGEFEYTHLINTIPLDQLLGKLRAAPTSIQNLQAEFKHASTLVLGFGFRGEPPACFKMKNWIYFPEDHFPFFRASLLSNYTPALAPQDEPCWSLLLELTWNAEKTTTAVADCLKSLHEAGLLPKEATPLSTWSYLARYGYPVPFLNREKVLLQVQPYLESQHIFSRGRFGGWKYEIANQDHSFMQGKEIIDRLILGQEEKIYRLSDRA